jgi:hypothetical protein
MALRSHPSLIDLHAGRDGHALYQLMNEQSNMSLWQQQNEHNNSVDGLLAGLLPPRHGRTHG